MYTRMLFLLIAIGSILSAQDSTLSTLSNIHTFQTFLKDATITSNPYGEAGIIFSDYEFSNIFSLGIQGGYPINPRLEVGGHLAFENFSPDQGDGRSGITDITLAGRYKLVPSIPNISGGAYLTLPVGSDTIGYGNFNFGVFGALRYPLQNGIVVTGTVGLDFVEGYNLRGNSERDVASHIAAGGIYPVNQQLNLIGELNFRTDYNYIVLSAGGDFLLDFGGRVRGALGVGLQDGAPDLMIFASYLHTLH